MANPPSRLWAFACLVAFLVCGPAGAAQVGDPLAGVEDLIGTGHLDEAREILRQALNEPNLPQVRELEILESLLEAEVDSGRLQEAFALTDRALALARQHHETEKEADILSVRALILEESHLPDSAEKVYGEAIDVARKGGNVRQQAVVHKQLGFLALAGDRYESAVVHFESAARLFHGQDLLEDEVWAWLQLVNVYAQLGSRASASNALEKAHELSRRSGSRGLSAWTELLAVAVRFRFGEGDASELETRLLAALALPESAEFQLGDELAQLLSLASTSEGILAGRAETSVTPCSENGQGADRPALGGLGPLVCGLKLAERGELAAARELWSQALNVAASRERKAFLLMAIGQSYEREQRVEEAIRYYAQAAEVAEQTTEDVRLEELLADYLSDKSILFARLIDLLARSGRISEAFDYAERARARAFLERLGSPRLDLRQGADPELVREAQALRRQILGLERSAILASSGDRSRLSSELQQAREHYQSVLVRLEVTSPGLAARAKVEPLQVEAVRKELSSDASLVSYFVSFSQVHAWVLDKENFVHVAIPFGPHDLRRAVCWAEQVGGREGGRGMRRLDPLCAGETASAEDLYQTLIAPLRGAIHHRRLIVVPHGELHYLPFAALRDPASRRYLVEDFTLSYSPSASALGFLKANETAVAGKTLVLGSPKVLDPRLGPLPAARKEAEAVGRLLGTRPLFGVQASEGRLYSLAGKIDLLHIAAHGFYEPRSPLFSRITLAPDKDHDGNLEVHEILSDLDLSGVNLVVLSACETARGERSRGDEITGLTQAFLHAGSPGVISTLWNINDEASAVLMQDFYRRLIAGASAAEALRQSQLHLLNNPKYRDPYYWAAFGLTGDPQGRWKLSPQR